MQLNLDKILFTLHFRITRLKCYFWGSISSSGYSEFFSAQHSWQDKINIFLNVLKLVSKSSDLERFQFLIKKHSKVQVTSLVNQFKSLSLGIAPKNYIYMQWGVETFHFTVTSILKSLKSWHVNKQTKTSHQVWWNCLISVRNRRRTKKQKRAQKGSYFEKI